MCHYDLSRTPEISRKTPSKSEAFTPPPHVYRAQVPAIAYFSISPETHPWRVHGAGNGARRPPCLFTIQAFRYSISPWKSPPFPGQGAMLKGAATARASPQCFPAPPPRASSGPASPPAVPLTAPKVLRPGLTSPPTPSGSAFPPCAERSGPAYTFSRRPEARSLCGGPWSGGGAGRGMRLRQRPNSRPGCWLSVIVWKGRLPRGRTD